MMTIHRLSEHLYEEFMQFDEPWFIFNEGSAILLVDLPIWDS